MGDLGQIPVILLFQNKAWSKHIAPPHPAPQKEESMYILYALPLILY